MTLKSFFVCVATFVLPQVVSQKKLLFCTRRKKLKLKLMLEMELKLKLKSKPKHR